MNPSKKHIIRQYFIAFVCFLFTITVSAQYTASVKGKVFEKETGEPLPGATVGIKGTVIGTVTDIYGNFFLNVPAGSQIIEVRFLGFGTQEQEVTVGEDETAQLDFLLEPEVYEGAEVVITTQLLGQRAAINQQINSNTIVNVVSKDRIQELPDQNAAESVGRLPGIAIQRDGGEGTKVVVRGLSPRFNSITVNGERLPSTDPSDRSVDLSFLAPEALAGIEVFKALRPDMDADAIGGTVNFTPAKATAGFDGSQIRASFGYNGHAEEWGQPRLNASVGNRFIDNKLGVLVTGNFQRANRSRDVLDASFIQGGQVGENLENVIIIPQDGRFTDLDEVRRRFGASLTLDYNLNENSNIMLYSVWGQTERDELRFRRGINMELTRQDFQLRDRELSTGVITNSLTGTHKVGNGNTDIFWRTSASISRQKTPFEHDFRFREDNAFVLPEGFLPNGRTVNDYLPLLNNDLQSTYVPRGGGRFNDNNVNEDAYTAQVDVSHNLNLGSSISGKIKYGGKVRMFDRSRDVSQFRDNGNGPENGFANLVAARPNEYDLDNNNQILITNFLKDSVGGDFLNGDYDLGITLDADEIDRFYQLFGETTYTRRDLVDNQDYESLEIISAGYVMGEFNISDLTIVGGVRVERTDGEYSGFETASGSDDELGDDDVVVVDLVERTSDVYYAELLPQFNLKYQVTDWMDIRAAVTKSLARPNFQDMVPWVQFNSNDNIVNRGNPNLRHTIAWNYDLFLSFYNRFGLFTIGGFYKELDNIDAQSTSIAPAVGVEFPAATVNEPVNLPSLSTVRGVEIDLQANLASLPSPFNGIVLSANLTLIDSETTVLEFQRQGDTGSPLFTPDFRNVEREIPVPGQPDLTANIAVGYEKKGFSARVTALVQDNSLSAIGPTSEFDSFEKLLVRWDASLSQRVNENFQFYYNLNNITDAPIVSFQSASGFETSRELFGFTMDLGIKYTFR